MPLSRAASCVGEGFELAMLGLYKKLRETTV